MEAIIFGFYLDLKNMTLSGKVREFFIAYLLATLLYIMIHTRSYLPPSAGLASIDALLCLFFIPFLYAQWKSIVLWYDPCRPSSVNIWLSTVVTTGQINFNFTDIIHLLHPIHDIGSGSCSSLNICILTQLLIFAFWSFLRPFSSYSLQIWYSWSTKQTN